MSIVFITFVLGFVCLFLLLILVCGILMIIDRNAPEGIWVLGLGMFLVTCLVFYIENRLVKYMDSMPTTYSEEFTTEVVNHRGFDAILVKDKYHNLNERTGLDLKEGEEVSVKKTDTTWDGNFYYTPSHEYEITINDEVYHLND